MPSADDTILRPGDCLAGRYVIIEEIGRGGFGVVYRAVQQGVNRHVALKTLRKNAVFIPGFDFVDAFHKEALHTSQLKHPNTITVFDFGETEDGTLYLVTEFLEGETLYERLWRDRLMAPEVAIHVAKQIAKSLAEAHNNGIIHGDLKPANIFLCNLYGERDFVKVLDFGIAKLIGEVDPAGMGTPEYMSPEQFSGQPLLAASDIYSLGLIVFEMVVGRRPFDDQDTAKLARKQLLEPLPPMPATVEQSPLGYLIRKATSKEPAHRYEDGWALYQALEHLNNVQSPAAPHPSRAVPNLFKPGAAPSPPTKASSPMREAVGQPPGQRPTEASDPAIRRVGEELSRSSSSHSSPEAIRPSESRLLREEQPPLVGREAEKAWLLDRVAEMTDLRRPIIVILGGAAGVGKSRLGAWLVEEANLPDAVLRGSGAHRDGSPFALEGFRHALGDAIGLGQLDFSARSARRVRERLIELLKAPLPARLEPVVDALYGSFGADETRIEPALIVELLAAITAHRPLALHIDNIQNTDPATLDLVEALGAAERPPSILIMCSVRREALPAVPEIARRLVQLVRSRVATPRTLEALDDASSRALVTWLLERELAALLPGQMTQLEATLLDGLVHRSHGNPLYITELARHLVDVEFLDIQEGVARLKPAVELPRMIPPRIGGLLRLRVAQLTHRNVHGPLLEHLLLRAALLGNAVPTEVLADLLRSEAEQDIPNAEPTLRQLKQLLPLLTQEDLLASTRQETPGGLESSVRFTQPLIHQILEERVHRLPNAKLLHRLAARAKRRYINQGGLLPNAVNDIARHYQHADADDEAIEFFIEATAESTRQRRTQEALGWLERARTACGEAPEHARSRLKILLNIAHFHSLFGGYVDMEAIKVLAERLAAELGATWARGELFYLSALLARHRGQLDRAEEQFELAQQEFQQLTGGPPALRADLQNMDLRLLRLHVDHLPGSVGLGLAQLGIAWVAGQRSRFRSAEGLIHSALAEFQRVGFTWGAASAWRRLGDLYTSAELYDDALNAFHRALEGFGRTTPALDTLNARVALADVHALRGSAARAQSALDALSADLSEVGLPPSLGRVHRVQARIAALYGDYAAARDELRLSLEISQTHNTWDVMMGLLIEFGTFLISTDDPDNAARAAHKAVGLLNGDALSCYVPRLQLLHAAIIGALGERQLAMLWTRAAIESAEEMNLRLTLARGLILLASLNAQEPHAALPPLIHAEALLNELQIASSELQHAREVVALRLVASNQSDTAATLLHAALAGWRGLENTAEVTRLDGIIRQGALPRASSP